MTTINGKTAFITGGAKGIGLSIAKSFSNHGARIALVDIDEQALSSAENLLKEAGADVLSIQCDVANEHALRDAANRTVDKFGPVQLLVNNAGVSLSGVSGRIKMEDWRWIMDVNVLAVAHGVEIFAPMMREADDGHIVNVASMAGHLAHPMMSPYCASKFAVVGYSESLLGEFAETNISVSVLCPAWVRTDIHRSVIARPSGGIDADHPSIKMMEPVIASGIEPDLVGEWTTECVEANRFYIFTHPDLHGKIEDRNQRIKRDYDACIAYEGFKDFDKTMFV